LKGRDLPARITNFYVSHANDILMVYCPKCGKQNTDDARYCNNCGTDLATGRKGREGDECGEACSGRSRTWGIFWGIVVILIGIVIIIQLVLQNMTGLPQWVYDWDWGWTFGLILGAFFILLGAMILLRGNKRQ
jgi:hypothetical protein